MAWKNDIATLSVKLTGSASEFDKMISDSEKRLTGFAAATAQPFNMIRGLGTGLVNSVSNPFNSLLSDMTRFTSLIPGLGGISAALTHPIQNAQESMERLDRLGKDARRLGLDTQYLRGLQISAEDEAGAIAPVMARLLRFQSQLRSGSQEIEEPGGSPAGKIAKEARLDIEAWKSANPQELFRLFGKAIQDAAESGTEFDLAMRIGSRNAANLMNTLRNTDAVDEWVAKVKAAGSAMKANVALAEQWDDLMKEVMLKTEKNQDKMLASGGLMGMGWKQFGRGEVGGGLDFMMQGGTNWLKTAFGGGAEDMKLPGTMGRDLMSGTQKFLGAALGKGADKDKIGSMLTELDEIYQAMDRLGDHSVTLKLAERLAGMRATANDLIPKKPVQTLEDAAAKAAALKENLQAVADISKHMTSVFENERLGRVGERLSITDAMLNPEERTAKELNRLATLGLDDETMMRKLKSMRKALMPGDRGETEAGVALSGSQEWAKAFTRQTELADEDALDVAKQSKAALDRIEDAIKALKMPQPITAPP